MDITGSLTGNIIGDVTGKVDGTVAGKTPAEADDAMNLAVGAIKKVSYDETTAFPLAAADASATELARVGVDGDTLKSLSDQMDDVKTDTEAIVVDTGTDIPARFTGIEGATFDTLTDSLEVIRNDRTLPAAEYALEATIGVAGAGLTGIASVGAVAGAVGSVTAAVTTDTGSRTASKADVSGIEATLGTVPALDGAPATVGGAIGKIADDNGGTDYDATTDSLNKVRSAVDAISITGGGTPQIK
jgi:hypothetical protein